MFKSKEGWGLPSVSAIPEKYSLECKSLHIFSCVFPLLLCWQSLLSLTHWLMVLELPWALRGCAAALIHMCVFVVESSGHFLVLLLSFICHTWVSCCRHRSLNPEDEVDCDASVHQQKGLLLLLWQQLSAELVSPSESFWLICGH